LGCSTGFVEDLRGQWPELVDVAAAISSVAVELSALSAPELPALLAYLDEAPRLPFDYVSVHAPSKEIDDEDAMIEALRQLPPWIDAIVIHPDTIDQIEHYAPLGRRLLVENMDTRKPFGRTAGELATVLDALPAAGVCLDIAHAKDQDPTMDAAMEMVHRFSSRLRQVHVSSLDGDHRHVPLTAYDEQLFAPVLSRCKDVPWILEAPPPI
jgi:sugar phosphate isomerase/epimerase